MAILYLVDIQLFQIQGNQNQKQMRKQLLMSTNLIQNISNSTQTQ
jgi:hypothetical protein